MDLRQQARIQAETAAKQSLTSFREVEELRAEIKKLKK